MGVLEILVPPRCGGCDGRGPSPCASCVAAMRTAPGGRAPAGLDRCRAAVAYEGPARRLVAGLKYRNGRAALGWMAAALATVVGDDPEPDVIAWIPAAGSHRRTRGFDHGRLLAQALGSRLGVPVRPLLQRGAGPAQTGRSLEARRTQRPRLRGAPLPAGLRVLLVDDVWTSGASLEAAAMALRRAGAAWVGAVTVARTPLKGAPGDDEAKVNDYGELPPAFHPSPGPAGAPRARAGARRAGGSG